MSRTLGIKLCARSHTASMAVSPMLSINYYVFNNVSNMILSVALNQIVWTNLICSDNILPEQLSPCPILPEHVQFLNANGAVGSDLEKSARLRVHKYTFVHACRNLVEGIDKDAWFCCQTLAEETKNNKINSIWDMTHASRCVWTWKIQMCSTSNTEHMHCKTEETTLTQKLIDAKTRWCTQNSEFTTTLNLVQCKHSREKM